MLFHLLSELIAHYADDIVGMLGVALSLCAMLALGATRRLAASLGRSIGTIEKLTTKDAATVPKGATAFGVRLLDRFVSDTAEA